jgi:cell division protein FtsN
MFKKTLLKKVQTKSSKAITFKTATFIVVGLHVAAYFGFVQWSSHRAKMARIVRAEVLQKKFNEPKQTNIWPSKGKPKVVALAKPQTPTVEEEVNGLLDSFKKAVEFTTEQREVLTKALSKATNEQKQQISDILKTAVTEEQKKKVAQAIKSAIKPTQTKTAQSIPPQTSTYKSAPIPKYPSTRSYKPSVISSQDNVDVVISPNNSTTYVSNGVHYITSSSSEVISSKPILY